MRRAFVQDGDAGVVPIAARLEHRGEGIVPIGLGLAQLLPRAVFELAAPATSPVPETSDPLAVDLEATRRDAEVAGLKAAKEKVEAVIHRYLDAIGGVAEARSLGRRFEAEEIVELALMVAKAVIERESTLDSAPLVQLVEDSLASFDADSPVQIRVAPADRAFIVARRPELLERKVEIVADTSISIGGFVMEASRRRIDASVDSRLEGLRQGLIELLREAPADERSC